MDRAAKKALIIGAGVSGLTTAHELLNKGWVVTIVAEKFAPDIVSVVAGALWEWPPAVCGYHHDSISLERSKKWCMRSFYKFDELNKKKTPGVYMRMANFYFSGKVENNELTKIKRDEISENVPRFINQGREKTCNINKDFGIVDWYSHLAPVIDTDTYMMWLKEEVESKGGIFVERKISGKINSSQLKEEFDAQVIICCAGLGTASLRESDMYPLRGALIRMLNDGNKFPKITEAYCVSHVEGSDAQDIVFIVPRGENLVVLGGLAEDNEWDLDLNIDSPQIKQMYDRCIDFMPMLKNGVLDNQEPVRAGLRPFRNKNVCLEYDENDDVLYNYAHGGAGFSFSWGCAEEVLGIVENEIL